MAPSPRPILALVFLMSGFVVVLTPSSLAASPSAITTNFSMSANPTSLTIVRGASATSTITVKSQSFVGPITLSDVVTPPGPSASLNPAILLLLTGSNSSVLTVSTTSSTLPGNYTVKVTGTNLVTSHTVNVSVKVVSPTAPDFSVSLSPSTITMLTDTSAPATVRVSSLNGFTGSVTLTSVISPSAIETTLNPTSLALSSGGVGTSTLAIIASCGTPIGVYSVMVSGTTAGGLSHIAQASVTLDDNPICHPDFDMALNPVSIDITAGSHGTSNVTLTSVNGFAGELTVTLASPSGIKANLTRPTVLLKANAANFTIVTVDTSTTTSAGTYVITVDATNGTIGHSTTLTVSLTQSSSSTPPPAPVPGPSASSKLPVVGGLVLGNFLEGTAIFVALVAGALIFLRIEERMKRRRRAPPAPDSDTR